MLTFNGSFEALSHSDHDVGAKDPEHIIDKQASQEQSAGLHVVEVEQLHAVNGEG